MESKSKEEGQEDVTSISAHDGNSEEISDSNKNEGDQSLVIKQDDIYQKWILILFSIFALFCAIAWYKCTVIEKSIDIYGNEFKSWQQKISRSPLIGETIEIFNHMDALDLITEMGIKTVSTPLDNEIDFDFHFLPLIGRLSMDIIHEIKNSKSVYDLFKIILTHFKQKKKNSVIVHCFPIELMAKSMKVEKGKIYIHPDSSKLIFFVPQKSSFEKDLISPSSTFFIALKELYFDSLTKKKDNVMVHWHPNLQVTFSLLIPDPANGIISWNIRETFDEFIHPFLDRIGHLTKFKVNSQILYYHNLKVSPSYDPTEHYFFLTEEQLPHFINAGEWNLDSPINSNPSLHFVVYVPKIDQTPFVIKRKSDGATASSHSIAKARNGSTGTTSTSFMLPQWGGVCIYSGKGDRQKNGSVKLEKTELIMMLETFLSQMRLLIGLPSFGMGGDGFEMNNPLVSESSHISSSPKHYTYVSKMSTAGVSLLERKSLTLLWLVRNVRKTQESFSSIARMLEKLPHMPVYDQVHDKLNELIKVWDQIEMSGKVGDVRDLETSYTRTIMAVELMESAFFDPSMMPQLYFPETNKLGVYMPLMLPIYLPILFSVVKLFIEKRKKRKKQ